MSTLACDNVGKSYTLNGQPKTVLSGVSMTVERAQIQVIVGISGCGKSTLLRILAGLIEPDEGSVQLDGRPLVGPTPEVGIVFQNYATFPWMTALENVAAGLYHTGLSRIERRRIAAEHLDLVGLADYASSRPGELSGGMQQRVAIARTYAMDPKVLLMDEPFGALDAITREVMQADLLQINAQKQKPIVFVTHDIDEAIAVGSRITVMTRGPGRIAGTVENVGDRVELRRTIVEMLRGTSFVSGEEP